MNTPQSLEVESPRRSPKSLAGFIHEGEGYTSSKEFYQKLRENIEAIKSSYAQKVRGILDIETMQKFFKDEPDETEILMLVDENDEPLKDNDGVYVAEFRGNWYDESYSLDGNIDEQAFCRAVMFLLEDSEGNVLVPERAKGKGGGGLLSIAGGHVTNGDEHLETCLREATEELGYDAEKTKKEPRLIGKFRRNAPWNQKDTKKAGQILSVYRLPVESIDDITFDTKEIANMSVFSKEELFAQLANNLSGFIPFHAYAYLNYLDLYFSENGITDKQDAIRELKEILEKKASFGLVTKIS